MSAHALRRPVTAARRGQNRSRRAVLRLLVSATTAAAMLAACWWLLAPPALGGATSLALVDGTSMLPRLHRGDLVIVRSANAYRVGDVVAYRSRLLHRIVLHRIVGISGGRYTFRGDNNSWTDPEQPGKAALIGKQRLHIPRVGLAAEQLRRPVVAATIAALLVLALGIGGAPPRKTRVPKR